MGCHTWYYVEKKLPKLPDLVILRTKYRKKRVDEFNLLLKVIEFQKELDKKNLNVKDFDVKSFCTDVEILPELEKHGLGHIVDLYCDWIWCAENCDMTGLEKIRDTYNHEMTDSEIIEEELNFIGIDNIIRNNKFFDSVSYTNEPRIYGYPDRIIRSKKAMFRYHRKCYKRYQKYPCCSHLGIAHQPMTKREFRVVSKFFKKYPNGAITFG